MRTRSLALTLVAAAGSAAVAGPFTPGNLVVSQMGDGSAALTNAATAVFLREYSALGVEQQVIALPTVVNGANRRITNSGTATSEGALTRSVDGRFLVLAGYDAAPGTAGVVATASATTNRVIARIGADGVADTTTALSDAYSANNIRSAASVDGSAFWTGGTATGTGGIRYATYGGTTTTQISATVTNTRVVNIFGGQLYTSSASGAFQGVSTVGTGVPTTSGNTTTLLPGFPTATGPGSYDYFLAGPTTIYVADDRATASGGGLQKWVFGGATWTLAYTMNTNLTAGLRGLTGVVNPDTSVTLYAITADSSANKLVVVTDAGATSPFSTLATAGTNTAFRGVDFAPFNPTPPTPPTGVGAAAPASVNTCGGGTTLLTVATTPGANPASTGISVVGDLSSIGLSATQTFVDNGTGGDVVADDGIYSYTATIANTVTTGAKTLAFAVTDAQSRSSAGSIALLITEGTAVAITGQPSNVTANVGDPASFSVTATGTPVLAYQWRKNGVNIVGGNSATFAIASVAAADAGSYDVVVSNLCGSVTSGAATLTVSRCIADTDDGTGSGTPDGGVGIEDLLYYLGIYDGGLPAADVDDGTGSGTPDGGVGIEDLLYYLTRYDSGC